MTAKTRLTGYLKTQWKWVLLGSITGIVMNTTIVVPAILFGKAIDGIAALGRAPNPARLAATVGHYTLFYLIFAAVFAVARFGKRYGFRMMANRVNCALRQDILGQALAWPVPRFEQERIGDLMSRAVGDVKVLADVVQAAVTEIFDTGLMMASSFVALLVLRPILTLWATLPIVLALLAAQSLGPYIYRRATTAREVAARLNNHLQPTIGGVRVLRFLGREEANAHDFTVLSREQMRANTNLALLQGGVIPVYSAIASLGILFVIGGGGASVINGTWTVGGFTSYMTMFTAMAARTLVAARVMNRVHIGRAAWQRIRAKLGLDRDEGRGAAAPMAARKPAGVEVNLADLYFSFPGGHVPVLRKLSLDVAPGEFVGVTGPVGSGKTALASALSGLYPYQGSIRLDGRELSALTSAEKVDLVSYMGQEDFLFSSTIAENIAFAPLESLDDRHALDQATHWAALADDLTLFAQGYETHVGEGGMRVSGGQRQRIVLARALYAGKPFLILDDPFSAVDLATEIRIIKRIREAFIGRTIFLFSHRLASFALTDKVVLLKHGEVEELGRHDELLAKGGTYARIFSAQQWMEEHQREIRGGLARSR